MTFRYGVSAILAVMAFMLSVCAAVARRSEKEIGKAVAKLCAGLVFPVLGNLIIVASVSRNLSLLGSYIYVPGMDLVMYALVNFTEQYCKGVGNGQKRPAALPVYPRFGEERHGREGGPPHVALCRLDPCRLDGCARRSADAHGLQAVPGLLFRKAHAAGGI